MCGTLALLLPQPTPLPLARARLLRALATLQHRGQAGYGFADAAEGSVVAEVHAGLVPAVDASPPPPPPDAPATRFLLGHVRYPTSAAGARDGLAPLQPLTGTHPVLGRSPSRTTATSRRSTAWTATAHDNASFEEGNRIGVTVRESDWGKEVEHVLAHHYDNEVGTCEACGEPR